MNDLDFVNNFDEQLGSYYQKAKNYCIDTPTHSLIILRSFVSRFTELLATHNKINLQKTYLYKKIEQLSIVKKIDNQLISTLHEIRVDANQGAHFDKSNLSLSEFLELAKLNLTRVCKLIELFYLHRKEKIPSYIFEDVSANTGSSITKEMCYQAIMEDDLNAQYIIGLNLQAKAKLEHIKEYAQLKNAQEQFLQNSHSLKLLEQSTYWFKQASQSQVHAESIFEFAMCLLNADGIKEDKIEGERLISLAANKKSINAQAILGAFYLQGSSVYKQNYPKALQYLKNAAKEEHPEALTNLSYMYKDAIGVKRDLKLSFKYMQKASYAGFSHAQYHLSNFYFNAIGTEKDYDKALDLLDKSFKNEYPPAILTKARLLLKGELLKKDLHTSEQLYITYIELENDVQILYELAEHYTQSFKGLKSKKEIDLILQKCISNTDDFEIKNKAIQLLAKNN